MSVFLKVFSPIWAAQLYLISVSLVQYNLKCLFVKIEKKKLHNLPLHFSKEHTFQRYYIIA